MAITNGYATLAELKQHVNVSDTTDDTLLERAIESASRAIDHHVGQRFWLDSSDRTVYLTTTSSERVSFTSADKLEHRSLATLTTFQIDTNGDGQNLATLTVDSDFVLEPRGAATDSRPYTSARRLAGGSRVFPTVRYGVVVTGKFGWPSVPIDVEEACLLLAARMFYRKNSPEGVLSAGDLGVVRVSAQDRDVQALLAPYRPVLVA